MKRLLVYAPANYLAEASFRVRLVKLAEPLRRRGFALDFQVRSGSPWGRLALARTARQYDGVILHRKMLDPYEARALRRQVKGGGRQGRIFMDIDDATMLHETELGAWARWRLERRFEATLKIVDVACAGNPYLGKMFEERGVRTMRVPSAVDPAAYRVKEAGGDGKTLVWIGSQSTMKYLEESFPALQAAAERVKGLRLVVVCDAPPSGSPVPVEHVAWSEAGEAGALLKGDIGIAPTPENRWTRGKCGFKIVQYMAAGLPVVASPVGLNVALLEGAYGAGAAGSLPGSWAQWPAAIERLATDAGLRRDYGRAGREQVEREFCVERMAQRWAEVLAG